MNSIGIFGGTFNPIHNGHINLINQVIEHLELDKIIIMPTKIPPHKQAKNLASECDRLEMCRLAFLDNPAIEVSNYEMKHQNKSYTVLTLRYFKKQYPDAKLYFIMGSDMILSFHTWYNYEEILRLATIVSASRNANDYEKIEKYSIKIREIGGEIVIIPIAPYELSSTQIRDSIKANKDLSCFMPEKVVKYIESNNIFK